MKERNMEEYFALAQNRNLKKLWKGKIKTPKEIHITYNNVTLVSNSYQFHIINKPEVTRVKLELRICD